MAEAFNAGTVWVQVVPSMKGFKTSVTAGIKTPVEKAANNAGNVVSRTVRKIKAHSAAAAKSLPDEMGKSLPALRVQAKQLEKTYTDATGKAERASKALADARKKEEASALRVEKAERVVARARKTSDPTRIATAERLLTNARDKHAKATKDASAKLSEHTRATAEQTKANRNLKAAQDELNKSIEQTPKQNPFKKWAMDIPVTRPIVQQFERLPSTVSKHVGLMRKSVLDGVGRLPAPVAKVGSSIGKGLTGAFKTAGIIGSKAFNGVRGALNNVAGAAMAAAGVIGGVLTASISGAVDRVDILNNFPRIMENLGYAQDDAARSAEKLADRLTGLPTALQDIVPLVQRLAPLSDSLDEATEVGLAFNNMALASGKSVADQSRAMEQYTQMLGTQTVDLMSWRTLMEVMPGQLDQMAVALLGTGAKSMDLYKAMQDGTVTFDEFNAAMVRLNNEGVAGFASFEQQARDATKGIKTSFVNLRSRITAGVANIIDAIGAERITAPIERVSQAISSLTGKIAEFISSGGVKKLAPTMAGIAAAFGGLLGPLSKSFKTFAGRIPVVGNALAKLIPGITGPVGVAIGLVTSMIANSKKLRDALVDAFKGIGEAFGGVFDSLKSSGGLFESISGLMGRLGDVLAPIVTLAGNLAASIISLLGPALEWVAGILEKVVGWVDAKVVPVLASMWDWVAGKLTPMWSGFGGSAGGAWDKIKTAVSTGWDAIKNVFKSLWDFVTVRLAPVWELLATVAQTAWGMITEVVSAAWSGLKTVFDTIKNVVESILAPVFTWLYTSTVKPVFGLIVGAIKVAWAVIKTIFNLIIDFVTKFLAPTFTWLYKNIVQPVFKAITTAIRIAWSIIAIVFNAIVAVVGSVLGPVFEGLSKVVTRVWDAISSKISSVWDWLKPNVFDKMKATLKTIGDAFGRFKDTVAKAFNAIKGAAAKPVNFVINTVYNDGIKAAFDTIAAKVGISTRMPKVSPIAGYAEGGVLPGYTPGRDVHRFWSPTAGTLLLSGGEGIIRPDALKRLGGKKWLDKINKSRGRGFSPNGDVGRESAYAEGGVWGRVKGFGSKAWSKVAQAADFVSDAILDPLKVVKELITGPAEALLSTINKSMWGQIVAGMPRMLFDGIGNLFKTQTAKLGGTGLVGAARKFIGTPYVWGGSAIPPGLDCSGLVYLSMQQLGKNVPRLTAAGYQATSVPVNWGEKRPGDLLFWGSPASHVAIYSGNGRMVEAPRAGMTVRETPIWGSPSVGRYKYDDGGYLPTGVSQVLNATGKPEPVFTTSQWDTLSKLVNQPQDMVFPQKVELVLDDQTRLPAYVRALADERIITAQRIVRSKR